MNVIVVRRVIAGRQHRREIVASGQMNVVQEALLFRCAVPALLHRDLSPIGERKGGDVNCIAEGMLGNA